MDQQDASRPKAIVPVDKGAIEMLSVQIMDMVNIPANVSRDGQEMELFVVLILI